MSSSDGKIRVFISHKHDTDAEIVSLIEEEFHGFGLNGELEILSSQDPDRPGVIWRADIRQKLRIADYFVLLVTDVTADLNWCMFEAGLFYDTSEQRDSGIFCVVPEGYRVKTLSDINQVAGDNIGELVNLIRKIYLGSPADKYREFWWESKGEAEAEKKCIAIVKQAYSVRAESIDLLDYRLKLKFDWTLSDENEPDKAIAMVNNAAVTSVNSNKDTIADLFSRNRRHRTWQSLKNEANNPQWMETLTEEIAQCLLGKRKGAPAAVPTEYFPNGHYVPMMHKFTKTSGRKAWCTLAFLPQNASTTPINSFEQLIKELIRLLNTPEKDRDVYFLAKTPALGYLARSEDEWNELEAALRARFDSLHMITLTEEPLHEFHNSLAGKETAHSSSKIDTGLIKQADLVSAQLSSELLRSKGEFFKWKHVGDQYIFFTEQEAILISPSFLRGANHAVDMYGLRTTDAKLIDRAREAWFLEKDKAEKAALDEGKFA